MSRYSLESSNTSIGVRINVRRVLHPAMPNPISSRHKRALNMLAVETAVFIFAYSPEPNSWDTMTEQPILQPKAKAIKIKVTS